MNRLWTRVFIAAACGLILLFFCNDFGIIDIQKTAIVVAIGIDKSQTDEDKYDVTAQIAIPVSSGSSSADAACQITVKNAVTIGEAIAEVNSQTGWFPTLVYCNLVLFGEDAVKRDVFDALDYFLRNNFVPDTALVAVVKDRCDKILSSKSPVNDMSSTALTKTLSSEAQKSGMVMVTNLKDFSKGYYSPASSGMLPFIEMKTSNEEQADAGSSGGSQQSFNEIDGERLCACSRGEPSDVISGKSLCVSVALKSVDKAYTAKRDGVSDEKENRNAKTYCAFPFAAGFTNPLSSLSNMKFKRWNYLPVPLPLATEAIGRGKSSENKPKIFNASKTALFKDGVMVGMLDEEETLAMNIATAKTELATLRVETEEDEKKSTYVLQVKSEKQGRKLRTVEDGAKFTIKIECSSEIIDASKATTIEEITRTQIVQQNVLRAAEKHLEKKLDSIFSKSKNCGCDVFAVQQSLYRYNYKYYEKLKDSVLQTVEPEYKIKFTTFK